MKRRSQQIPKRSSEVLPIQTPLQDLIGYANIALTRIFLHALLFLLLQKTTVMPTTPRAARIFSDIVWSATWDGQSFVKLKYFLNEGPPFSRDNSVGKTKIPKYIF